MPRLARAVWAALTMIALGAIPLHAQSQATTGVIEGTVVDESGASVPGATVTLKNTATNFERVVSTNADGRFRGLLLPLGPYRVTVTMSGFATLVREGIDLDSRRGLTFRAMWTRAESTWPLFDLGEWDELLRITDEVAGWEPAGALRAGPTGLEAIEEIVVEAPRWLCRSGVLALELAPHQADRVRAVARDAGFGDVDVRPDLAGRPRVLVARIG